MFFFKPCFGALKGVGIEATGFPFSCCWRLAARQKVLLFSGSPKHGCVFCRTVCNEVSFFFKEKIGPLSWVVLGPNVLEILKKVAKLLLLLITWMGADLKDARLQF